MTGISYGDGGTKRSIDKVYYQDGGTRRTIQKVYYQDGSTRRLVYSAYTPVSATISATSVTANGGGVSTTTVQTTPVTATGQDGSGSYTYSWERVSGVVMAVSAATAASTRFSYTLTVGSTVTSVYRCKVSDGTSSAYTPNITITLKNTAL